LAASVARYALCKPGMEGEGEEAVMRTIGRVDWLMGRYDTKGDASHPMHGRPAEPAQCAIYTAALNYVNAVESALDSPQGHKGVHEYGIVQKQDLLDLVLLTRTELSKEDRSRVMVMITMDAHGRDTIADLVKQEVDDKGQFQWSR